MSTAQITGTQDYIAVGIVGRGDAPRAKHIVMLTPEQFKQQRIHTVAFEGLVKSENEALWQERAALHLQAEKFLDEGRGLTYGTAMLMRLGAPVAAEINQLLCDALTSVLKGISDETVRLNARWGKGLGTKYAQTLFEQAVAAMESDLGLPLTGKGFGWMFAKKSPAYAAKHLALNYIRETVMLMDEEVANERQAA